MSDYISKEGLVKLQKQLTYLKTEERPSVLKQVVTAREMGDLKENAEYHAARERQRQIDGEISRLQARLGLLKVVDTAVLPKDAVRFGARVFLEDLDTKEYLKYKVVGVDEVNLLDQNDDMLFISIASPIGKSLLGKKVGDDVLVSVPSGQRRFKVLEIN